VNGVSGSPIQRRSTAEVLASFDSDSAEIAGAISRGQYVFWLGSGISRSVVPDLKELLKKLLHFLHPLINSLDESCPFARAFNDIFDAAQVPDHVRHKINLSDPLEEWPLNDLITHLLAFYSDVLDVDVRGKDRDFLVWDGIDIKKTYGADDLKPDTEHLCVAILVLEGLVKSAQTTNWDGLIESALKQLVGDKTETILRVVVHKEDFAAPSARAELVKFHGCAVRAAEDPKRYRHLLIARKSQISGWATNMDYKMMKQRLEHLIASQPVLIVGFSAQDQNIHSMLHQSREDLARDWPESPPGVVIADIRISNHHTHTLESIYGSNYHQNKDGIDKSALLRAYAKPVLLGLVLFTLADKLCSWISNTKGLSFDAANVDRLQQDIRGLRDTVANAQGNEERPLVEQLIQTVTRVLSVFRRGELPNPDSSRYEPLSVQPVSETETDPNFPGPALGGLAVAISLISRGMAREGWTVEVGRVTKPTEGVLQVAPPDRKKSHLFIVQDTRALARLETDGYVDMADPAVLVIRADQDSDRTTRSPMIHYGRTGNPAARELSIEAICTQTSDADELFGAFRLEADL